MDASRELHQVPARRNRSCNPARMESQLQHGPELITQSNSNQVPMNHNCQPARSTLLDRSANRLGVDRFADVRSCWPWDPSRQLHRVPARRGLHHAGPVGVDHSIELPTGPQGIAAAGPVGVDHSIELQPGPHGIQGCASCRRVNPGLCILLALGSRVVHRVPARRRLQLQTVSESIT